MCVCYISYVLMYLGDPWSYFVLKHKLFILKFYKYIYVISSVSCYRGQAPQQWEKTPETPHWGQRCWQLGLGTHKSLLGSGRGPQTWDKFITFYQTELLVHLLNTVVFFMTFDAFDNKTSPQNKQQWFYRLFYLPKQLPKGFCNLI